PRASFLFHCHLHPRDLHSFPTRRSSDLVCSVLVSIILKLARRYEVSTNQIIAWNYPTAVLLNIMFYKPEIQSISFNVGNTSLYLTLGFLLPAIFWAIAASIRYTGIVRTDIAQRTSIFIPLIAA